MASRPGQARTSLYPDHTKVLSMLSDVFIHLSQAFAYVVGLSAPLKQMMRVFFSYDIFSPTLLLFSKYLAQLPFHYFLGLLWLQNFKQLFLTHFCTDSLDSLSKCVLLIIAEVPIPLSKQYY
jgi:hypothetical protein